MQKKLEFIKISDTVRLSQLMMTNASFSPCLDAPGRKIEEKRRPEDALIVSWPKYIPLSVILLRL